MRDPSAYDPAGSQIKDPESLAAGFSLGDLNDPLPPKAIIAQPMAGREIGLARRFNQEANHGVHNTRNRRSQDSQSLSVSGVSTGRARMARALSVQA